MSDNIDYSGKPGDYQPSIGSSTGGPSQDFGDPVDTYADLDDLLEMIQMLVGEAETLITMAEGDLSGRAIVVTQDDTRLHEANNLEWPSSLGDPRNKISYRYYKALRVRDTSSAAYIRKRYEEAARDVAGSNAIDVISLAEIILDEALLIREFLSANIGNVDDAAEYRTLELLQDWTIAALNYTREFRGIFEARDTARSIVAAGLGVGSAEEAKQSQAVFKIKLNAANDDLVRDLDFVRKNYSEYASVFFNKFLGPALEFRLEVGRKTFPLGHAVAAEVDRAAATMDSNLEAVLADQLRRNNMFIDKMNTFTQKITKRDEYRGFIYQLGTVGKPVPKSGPGILVETQDTEEEIRYFDTVSTEPTPTSFAAPHSALGDLGADDHPQYLLKTGGTLTGDLKLAPGVKVDGIIPHSHSHTGTDGSAKITGANITGGTVTSDVVDPIADKPARPENLRLLNLGQNMVPPGVVVLQAELAWDGSGDNTYEIQVVQL